jgi:hypothetical protein
MLVDGCTHKEIAEVFNVRRETVTYWRKDPRVAGPAMKMIEDRILQVTRKTDAVIAQRLQNADQLTTKELLDIRKEFLGGALRAQTEKADEGTLAEAMEALERNPALVADIQAAIQGRSKPVPSAEELDAMVNGDDDG